MVSFLGDLKDLVSSVTTVAKEISKEVVSDVKSAVQTVEKENVHVKKNAKNGGHQINKAPQTTSTPSTTTTGIPSSLDLHHVITDRLLVMPQPTVDAWTAKCYFDERDHAPHDEIPFQPTVTPHRNDVVVLAKYLEQRHAGNYTVFNVSDVPAEDTLVRALQGQMVHCPWQSPSSPRSETPSLSALLEIVYTIHAFLALHKDHTAIIYCDNGKTRSALVVACYLTYIRHCRTCRDGFLYFLQQTGAASSDTAALQLWQACPPSLHTFARNFDQTVVELAAYRNPKPLLLRAIALQGIPVEDKPCLDIWDHHQRHIYSSHPELWTDLVDHGNISGMELSTMPVALSPPPTPKNRRTVTFGLEPGMLEEAQQTPLPHPHSDEYDDHLVSFASPTTRRKLRSPHRTGSQSQSQQQQAPLSQWADEEGFYRVNVVLEGDFCLLCRFGGVHAGSDKDNTKILFRYANTTVSMGAGGPYELPPTQVDLMRRYAHCFDPDDFLCTLLVEAHWNVSEVYWQERLNRPCQDLPPVLEYHDIRSVQRGWHLFQQHSVLQPSMAQVQQLLQEYHPASDDDDDIQPLPQVSTEMAKLCLQHSNLNLQVAKEALASIRTDSSTSIMARLWNVLQPPPPPPPEPPSSASIAVEEEDEDPFAEETQNILDILDSVDFGEECELEFAHFPNYDKFLPKRNKKDNGDDTKKSPTKQSTSPKSSNSKHSSERQAPLDFTSSFIHNMPRQGEIVNAFGEYYQDIHKESLADFKPYDTSQPLIMGSSRPQLPYVQPPPSSSTDGKNNRQVYSPMDDPANAAAVELLLQMDHPGISLKDLTNLMEASKHWNKPQPVPVETIEEEEKKLSKEDEGVLVAMGKGGVGTGGEKAGPTGPAPPLKDHPQFSKYFKLLKGGTPVEEVKEKMKEDGKDASIADLDPEKSLSAQRPSMADLEATIETAPNAVENAQKALQEALLRKRSSRTDVVLPKGEVKEEDPDEQQNPQAKLMAALAKNKATADGEKEEDRPLRTDPEYAKYFKMLKMGMSKEQIQHAMKRDEKDPTIIELDPERSLLAQRPPPPKEGSSAEDPPLKDDPVYAKYFKMIKMGMPKAQVTHAMTRDDKDPAILELDPDKSLKSQQGGDDGPPLNEDPEYQKYFKMLKMGMVKEQIAHALQRDGKDPKILDLDPTKSLKSQQKGNDTADTGPPLKDDEEYKKYFKMLKMGMAKEQVVHALQRDGKDPAVLDMDPNKSLSSQQSGKGANVDKGPPLKDDPEYVKYFKMLTMGLPRDAVKNALVRDGKDPSIMDLDPNQSVKSQRGGDDAPKDEGPPLKEDPEFVKYFKMLNMGLPKDAVKNALARDGKDPSIMDLDPEKSLKFQIAGGGEEEKDTGVPLKEDPEYTKYFKMMNMGLPKDAVKNALARDGKDPSIMDLDPSKSVEFQMKKKSGGGSTRRTPSKKKKKVRRKKIYWTPINPEQIKEDSIWNLVKGSVGMEKLDYDVKEFEDLFTESADPADRKKNKRKKTDSSKQKKSVQVIDGKRSMNGGIILARMKVEYKLIAKAVDEMQHRKFDATQMKALKEFLPTVDERQGLKMYMKKGEQDPKVHEELYKDLSECEKYMYTMIDVPRADEKFDCMLFRSQFKVRFEDLLDAIKTVEAACDETRNSKRLRQMMAMILTLVNQINTGGETSGAAGFSLDALLKLNEAKAFDKKTSVLMYLAKLVKKNDATLLGFQEDLATVRHAENIILDSLAADIKTIEADLEKVHVTAADEAARLEKAGELKPFSLSDLRELKTSVYTIESVPHFNRVDHKSGRTPMERFSLQTQDALKQATKKIDILKKKYQSLLLYFGEDEKMPSNEFFGVMRRFIEEFEKANDQVEKLETARIKEEKRDAKRAEQEKRKSAKASQAGGGLPSKEAMANLASLAAAKSGTKKKDSKSSGIGGIAAMAAAKAGSGPGASGIAAMAAMAASKKTDSKPGAGGIAAMAAMAANRKTDAKPASGGIAAMAAMAASQKAAPKPSSSGGIAAMAAMAAKKKTDSPAPGGLAAMAAMSAKKKTGAPAAGGLAAMAALSTKQKTEEPSPGGIAGMAALAAKQKKETPPSGGIAAMAAMAAQSKKEKTEAPNQKTLRAMKQLETSYNPDAKDFVEKHQDQQPAETNEATVDTAGPEKDAAPPVGLAAMAAAAKASKSGASAGGLAGMATAATSANKGKPAGQASGGLAAMAAAASADKSTAPVGGLAGMAAAAANKGKPTGSVDPFDGGLAAMMAAAQSNKSALQGASVPSESTTPTGATGGLAGMAAAAASANKGEPTGPVANFAGGLAAMAAAAKSNKNAMQGALATMASSPPAHRGVSPALSDNPRGKRKVYDKQSGLYGDKNDALSSSFSAAPDATLFHLGSGRSTPPRSKTAFSRVPHRKPSKGGDDPSAVPVPVRRTIRRSRSNGERLATASSFPPAATPSGSQPWLSSSGSFPPDATSSNTATTSAAASNDDFMAALGFAPKDDEQLASDPTISFTMRRQPREKKDEDC